MERRTLGSTSYDISVVGLGTWQIGGPGGAFAWPLQDERRSTAAIGTAVEAGINWIDTAPVYGFGRSEEIVGRALRNLPEPPLVFTKCGLIWDAAGNVWSDLSSPSIRREIQASLRRLQVEALDLVQVHWPFPDPLIEEALDTLDRLSEAGLVRAIGVSNFSLEQIRRAQARASIASLQPPYSLLRRDIEAEILPYCATEKIGVIVYSPLASGLLTMTRERFESLSTDDWRHRDPMFREPHLSEHLSVAELIAEWAREHGVSGAEVAIAWAVRKPGITGAILGLSRSEQVGSALAASRLVLSDEEVQAIEAKVSAVLRLPRPPDRFQPQGAPGAAAVSNEVSMQ